ncbi:MAG: ATP-binding protein [Anaerolineae bacterium]|nr:ATP-binding protein [Anaerolineae bacterium]
MDGDYLQYVDLMLQGEAPPAPSEPLTRPRGNGRGPGDAQTLADLAPWVSDLLKRRASREDKEAVAQAIGGFLAARGRLLLDTSGDPLNPVPYVVGDGGEILPLADDLLLFRAMLSQCGLNPTEATFNWTVADLQTRCVREGRKVNLARWTARKGDTLYLSCGPRHLVKVRGSLMPSLQPNGTDGVAFAADAALPEWEPGHKGTPPGELRAFQPPLEAPPEVPGYTPEAQRALLTAWLVGLVAGVRPLPLLTFIGARGSGKSTAARAICKLLLGEQGDLADPSLDERSFAVAVTRLPILALDNLDDEPADWLQNALAAAVTGANVTRRQLYTDAVLLSRPVSAGLVVTTRTALFASRPDLLERVLPIFVGDLPDTQRWGDGDLMRQVLKERDKVLSWLASTAGQLLPKMWNAPSGLSSRFQDFAKLFWTLYQGNANGVLEAWRAAQQLSIVDLDLLALAIMEYLPEEGLRGTPTEIVRELTNRGADLPYLGGGKAIGRKLRELAPTLRLAGIKMQEERSGNATVMALYR